MGERIEQLELNLTAEGGGLPRRPLPPQHAREIMRCTPKHIGYRAAMPPDHARWVTAQIGVVAPTFAGVVAALARKAEEIEAGRFEILNPNGYRWGSESFDSLISAEAALKADARAFGITASRFSIKPVASGAPHV